MALHIFNISVDTPDAQPESVPEDLSINDMESVVEIVLEKGLGIDNAIAEHDEPDESDAQNFEMSKEFKVCPSSNFTAIVNFETTIINIRSPYKEPHYSTFVHEINPPPPKA